MGNCVTTPEKGKPAPAVEQRRADPPQTVPKTIAQEDSQRVLQEDATKAGTASANNLVEQSTQKVTNEASPQTNMKEEITGAKTGVVIGTDGLDPAASAPNNAEALLEKRQNDIKKSDTIDLKPEKSALASEVPFD